MEESSSGAVPTPLSSCRISSQRHFGGLASAELVFQSRLSLLLASPSLPLSPGQPRFAPTTQFPLHPAIAPSLPPEEGSGKEALRTKASPSPFLPSVFHSYKRDSRSWRSPLVEARLSPPPFSQYVVAVLASHLILLPSAPPSAPVRPQSTVVTRHLTSAVCLSIAALFLWRRIEQGRGTQRPSLLLLLYAPTTT